MEKKWIEFREEKPKPKTKVFTIISLCDDTYLGEVRWFNKWRHYCHVIKIDKIEPMTDFLIFTDRCSKEISEFVTKLNEEHGRRRKN